MLGGEEKHPEQHTDKGSSDVVVVSESTNSKDPSKGSKEKDHNDFNFEEVKEGSSGGKDKNEDENHHKEEEHKNE